MVITEAPSNWVVPQVSPSFSSARISAFSSSGNSIANLPIDDLEEVVSKLVLGIYYGLASVSSKNPPLVFILERE